jgi:hypothetical protein
MNAPKSIRIDPLSKYSLRLLLTEDAGDLHLGTGFVVMHNGSPYLITNRHVLTGEDLYSGYQELHEGILPYDITIVHHKEGKVGSWEPRTEKLYDSGGKQKWIDHPLAENVDIVALPLNSVDSKVKIYPFDLSLIHTPISVYPGISVSIIGYPGGLSTGGGWPIWKTGHIAMDPDVDHDRKPRFLIDATARSGMSGSLVVLRIPMGAVFMLDGIPKYAKHPIDRFLGVYSAQNRDEELGIVWKPEVINEILDSI